MRAEAAHAEMPRARCTFAGNSQAWGSPNRKMLEPEKTHYKGNKRSQAGSGQCDRIVAKRRRWHIGRSAVGVGTPKSWWPCAKWSPEPAAMHHVAQSR